MKRVLLITPAQKGINLDHPMPPGTYSTEEVEFFSRKEVFFEMGRDEGENFYLNVYICLKMEVTLGLREFMQIRIKLYYLRNKQKFGGCKLAKK